MEKAITHTMVRSHAMGEVGGEKCQKPTEGVVDPPPPLRGRGHLHLALDYRQITL